MAASATSGESLAGTPYVLHESLGRGATGEVFRGQHTRLEKRVVVKVMNKTQSQDPAMADRMRLEAQALARLPHANLVAVIDSGISEGRPFFVMEDEGGVTLGTELAARGKLPPTEAIELACDALKGLEFMHDQGLVHRDIQPHNLLICPKPDGSGRVMRILDFGLVKVIAGHDKHGLAPLAFPTEEGTSLGTPRYLAPEQARGQKVDGRADVYGIAAVLYRAICGRDLFAEHEDLVQVLLAQATQPPEPPSRWEPSIGPALDAVLLQSLAKDPNERCQSAPAFAKALRRALADDAAQPAPAPAVEPISERWLKTEALDPNASYDLPPASAAPVSAPPVSAPVSGGEAPTARLASHAPRPSTQPMHAATTAQGPTTQEAARLAETALSPRAPQPAPHPTPSQVGISPPAPSGAHPALKLIVIMVVCLALTMVVLLVLRMLGSA